MLDRSLYLQFLVPLNQAGIEYVVTGSIASILYGEPRTTNDVDIVLRLVLSNAGVLSRVFPDSEFYCPPVDVLLTEIGRESNGHFNLIHMGTGFKADIYLEGSSDLLRWAIENRRQLEVDGVTVSVAPPEYVIFKKLEYFREGGSQKHLRDIESMLKISAASLNRPFLENLIREHGLEEHWKLLANS